jgi:hypothetical protein
LDKEKGRWRKKMGTGNERAREERRYEEEGTSKKYLKRNVAGLRKKEEEFCDYVRQLRWWIW